jgi:hypothetical protein
MIYKDIRLQHLNPGYNNKDIGEFLNSYQGKEGVIVDTFRSNELINEENFLIRIASMILDNWNEKNSVTVMLIRRINKEGIDSITLFDSNVTIGQTSVH